MVWLCWQSAANVSPTAQIPFPDFREDKGNFAYSAVCTENLNPGVVVVKSAKDGVCTNASGPLNGARDRCIFS